MNVRKSNRPKRPAYPTRRQFLAALGLGAVVAASPACVQAKGKPAADPPMQSFTVGVPAPAFREAELPGAPPFDPAWVTAAGTGTVYVVQKGDTLYGIAKSRLGDARRWREILPLNPGLVPARLPVGTPIRLPAILKTDE